MKTKGRADNSLHPFFRPETDPLARRKEDQRRRRAGPEDVGLGSIVVRARPDGEENLVAGLK
jgi:hypothetical protein